LRAAAGQTLQPANWDDEIDLPGASDSNSDPRIVEINLEARPAVVPIGSHNVEVWTYNGGLPGPLIRGRVGDRLIVHFRNSLPAPTTIHWHGLRVPIEMDGVPGYSQPEVEPGDSFTYDFVLPDAGLFWYHPHVRSAAQVGFGLYGPLLVDDPGDGVGVADELVLVLSDIAFDERGILDSPDSGGSAGMAFGREGNHLLVNGRERPTIRARNGAPQRWRVVNAAKSRHFQLDFGGITFTRIGGDGGLQEYPQDSDRLVLAAGERADVIIVPRIKTETRRVVQNIPYNRGYGSVEFRDIEDLFSVEFADEPAYAGLLPPRVSRVIQPLPQEGATEVKVTFTIAQDQAGNFEYGIDGTPFGVGRPIRAALGETQIWTLTNKTKWSHPFHLHGFFFQVLDEAGQPLRPLAWKDTVNVPLEGAVKLIVRFDERPGHWMYHCHILDHADGGLMGTVMVGVDEEAAPPVHPHATPVEESSVWK
jgi:FtsP/CotA-like multicopper oxidase with cupredoxin domain